MEQQFFKENWEARLNALLNWSEIPEKSAYICSPLRAEQAEMTKQNMLAARAYMLYAYERMQYRARAPHAFPSHSALRSSFRRTDACPAVWFESDGILR